MHSPAHFSPWPILLGQHGLASLFFLFSLSLFLHFSSCSPAHFSPRPILFGPAWPSLSFFLSLFSFPFLPQNDFYTAELLQLICLSLPPLLPVFSKIVSELTPSSLPPPSCAALKNHLMMSRPCLAAPPWSKKYLSPVQPDATRRRQPRQPRHRWSELQARAPLSHQPSCSPSCRIQSKSSRPL
jgi:hypothetical protein